MPHWVLTGALLAALGLAACAAPLRVDRSALPALHRGEASFHQFGILVPEPETPPSMATVELAPPVAVKAPTLLEVERAVLEFQRARAGAPAVAAVAWPPLFETVFAYLDQPVSHLAVSPLIRARVAAEFELDREQRELGPAVAELAPVVELLLLRIDRGVAAIRMSQRQLKEPIEPEGPFGWPLAYGLITSRFGYRRDPFPPHARKHHGGVDLAASPRDPVDAAAAGVVIAAGWAGPAGHAVRLRHADGWVTLYAHLASILVQEGQRVERGDVLGLLGCTGRATGHHLHFAVFLNGDPLDPLQILPSVPMAFSDLEPGVAFGSPDE